jgi:Tol biopolymer transport system component
MLAFGWDQAGNRFPYRQEVRILDLQAGTAAPRTVFTAEPREMLFPHDWTPDGKSIAMEILSAESLKVGMLSVESGSFRVLRTMLPNTRAGNGASMFISPVGRYVAFDFLTAGKPGRDIVVVDVAAGAEVATITHAADDALMGWTSDGDNILFASDRSGTWTIWSAAFRPGSALAEPRPVARDINPVDVALGVTASGEIWSLKKAPSNSSEVKVSSIDFATGQVLVPPTDIATEYLGTNSNPVWSPDGNYLAYISIRGTYYVPRIVLVIRSLTSNDVQEVRPALTNVGPSPNPPQALWTPDGRSIILLGAGSAGEGFYTVDVRTGATTFIVGGTIGGGSTNALRLPFGPKSLSPDGQRLYYRRGRGAQAAGGSIIERELISGTERTICSGAEGDLSQDGVLLYCFRTPYGSDQQVIVETNLSSGATRDILAPATARRVWVSPDGQSLLVAGENVGNVAVAHILSLRTGAPPVEITKQLVRFILWAPDSRAVVLGEGGEVWWTPTDGRPRRLLDALQFAGLQGVDLHPDGRRVARVYSAPRGLDEVWVLRGVLPAVKGGRP